MESQPQNPEFRNNPEDFHSCLMQYSRQVFQTRGSHDLIFLFLDKTYDVGTQKNCLNKVVPLNTHNTW